MSQNPFIWYELIAHDAAAARAFYCHVAGWAVETTEMAGPPYTLFKTDSGPVAGMMDRVHLPPETATAPPCWTGYVGVDDLDAKATEATALGGKIVLPPRDLPNVGRIAIVTDPQGAIIALFQPNQGEGPQRPHDAPGQFGWHELLATDWEAVFPFYASLFGWEKSTPVDMGPMGTYQLFSINGRDAGGMFSRPAGMPGPFWLYYINVGQIDDAVSRVQSGDGTVLNGPTEVPGGMWVAQCRDPQGAMFATVGKRG